MATQEIFAGRTLRLKVSLTRGKPREGGAEFVLLKDGEELLRQQAEFKGKVAILADYKTPDVDPEQDCYLLEYYVEVAGERFHGKHDVRVFARKLRVELEDAKQGGPYLGCPVEFQGEGGLLATIKTNREGVAEYRLPSPARVSALVPAPYEVTDWVAPKGQVLKAKVKRNFVAQFFAPRPGTEPTKQYVNLPTQDQGRDGNSDAILFEVGAQGDQDRPERQRIGQEGDPVFVKVVFGRESLRNQPKPILRVPGRTAFESSDHKEWTAELALKANGKATFWLNLGLAGGDTCTIKIGSTEACADEEISFVNWRRLYYEVVAPDFMGLEDAVASDGTPTFDLPENLRARITTYAEPCFLDYIVHRGHVFEAGAAPANTVFDAAYFGGTRGEQVYVLTDHTFTEYPLPFDRSAAPRCAYLKPCHRTYYSPGTKTKEVKTDAREFRYALPTDYFLEFSSRDGSRAIKSIRWETAVPSDQSRLQAAPRIRLATTSGPPVASGIRTTQVVVRDTVSGRSTSLDFGYGGDRVARPKKSISTASERRIQALLNQVFDPATLRGNGLRVDLEISGAGGSSSDNARLRAVQEAVLDEIRTQGHADPIFYHAGLDLSGPTPALRSGVLDPATDVELIDHDAFRIVLPNANPEDPGRWVGAVVAADPGAGTLGTCKVKLTIQFEPARDSLGLAGSGPQAGENLFVWKLASPDCSGDTLMHELAHSMGLTVMVGWNRPPPGLPYPRTVDEIDRETGNKGHIYDNAHGGSGSHCASGLDDAAKAGSDYDPADSRCGMLDNGPSSDPSPFNGFCDECQRYTRARDLSDITRSFR